MNQPNERTESHRDRWKEKRAVRLIYTELYERIVAACVPGRTLEIGGGSGNFKEFSATALSCDISFAPWLDFVADAQKLPFAPESLDNIVMFDVLHHIEFPALFFAEASRTLRPAGRIVMIEPAITIASFPFYYWVHAEPVRLREDPLTLGIPDAHRDVFDANQAIPTLIVGRYRKTFELLFPKLKIRSVRWVSLFAYPLSGGFQAWSAIPAFCVKPLLRLEAMLSPIVGRLMAFRMLVVIERTDSPHSLGREMPAHERLA